MRLASGSPMMLDDILTAVDLPDSEIPFTDLSGELERGGLHYIPRIGWWLSETWVAPDGAVHSSATRAHKIARIVEMFGQHGWPLHASKIEQLSGGEITERYIKLRYGTLRGRHEVRQLKRLVSELKV